MNYTIDKIHNQTVHLSLEQGKLALKIDNLKFSKSKKNINNV